MCVGDSLKQCDANNQNALNACLFQIVEDLRPFMPTGEVVLCVFHYLANFLFLSLRVRPSNYLRIASLCIQSAILERMVCFLVLHGEQILGMKVKVDFPPASTTDIQPIIY